MPRQTHSTCGFPYSYRFIVYFVCLDSAHEPVTNGRVDMQTL